MDSLLVLHWNNERMGINLHLVDASELFLTKLAGVTDPETKRKIIGNTFIEVFDEVRTMLYYIDMYMYMSFERLWVWVAGCLAIKPRVMGLRKRVNVWKGGGSTRAQA
jgi:hypothetical protein